MSYAGKMVTGYTDKYSPNPTGGWRGNSTPGGTPVLPQQTINGGISGGIGGISANATPGGQGPTGQRGKDMGKGGGGQVTPPNPYGTESGNTYLEDRYLSRLYGQDPAFNYAQKRGMEALGNQYGAAGMANSGAARQGESDFMANLIAQSQGQLDALAGGATGARQARTDSMFNHGMQLAGGQAGAGTAYDLGAAGNMQAASAAQQQMALNRAGVDAKANAGLINTGLNIWSMYNGGNGGQGGGGYYNANNPYPV